MFTPSRYIQNCALVITLATLAACADEGTLLGPDRSPSFVHRAGGNDQGNGAGGNGQPPAGEQRLHSRQCGQASDTSSGVAPLYGVAPSRKVADNATVFPFYR